MRKKSIFLFLIAAVTVLAGARAGWSDLLINGAGATFPYPIYSKWFDVYGKANPGVHINYQSIGSGGGIRMVTQKTVDFGASDAPMNDEQLKAAPGLLHFPTVMGAVVLAYNLPGLKSTLKLDGPVIADIFMGKITKWNDPYIAKLNPGVTLPDDDITPCHRSDGSGTTYIFSDYLSKVSSDWAKTMGKSTSLKWSGGLGGKGNEGVTALLQQTPGAIGYIELIYALNNHITFADLMNHDGKFVTASLDGVTAAGDAAARLANRVRVDVHLPAEFRVSITNAAGAKSYPISSFTYLLVYRQQTDKAKGQQIIDFLKWALHDGQQYGPALQYAPLPAPMVALEDKQIKEIRLPK
jgi:phosphate transport system substrate-binding protein